MDLSFNKLRRLHQLKGLSGSTKVSENLTYASKYLRRNWHNTNPTG